MSNLSTAFRELHNNPQPLCLANAWETGSARLIESLGAAAIATTSAGVSWALGYSDGNMLPVSKHAELAANIVRLIRIPLSVDIEGGDGNGPATVREKIKPFLDAGVIGINIEDGDDTPDLLAAKIEQIRETATARDRPLHKRASGCLSAGARA